MMLPTLMRLAADASDKSPSSDQHSVNNAHREDRKPPRRWPIDYAGAVLRIELSSVTRAEEGLRVSLPHRHGASLMRANCGVCYCALGRIFTSFRTELGRVEPDERHLIEQRSIPDRLGSGIHRVGQLLRTSKRQIFGLDDLSRFVAKRKHKLITGLRTCRLWILSRGDRNPTPKKTQADGSLQ